MYPIMVDLSTRRVVVFGGGKIATRKIREILIGGGKPIVISPEVTPEIQEWANIGQLQLIQRSFQAGDTQDADFIFICTNNSQTNATIQAEATSKQYVNNVAKKEYGDFYNMAVIREKDFLIAISTDGQAPSKSKRLKEKLNKWLTENAL